MRDLPARAAGPWRGETYYGLPAVKASPWDWKVSLYIHVAGVSGAAQLIGVTAERMGGATAPAVARRARWLALLAPVAGAPLLIADLHTPQRFYNMLRIFRPTSPMSIGTYLLMGFSLFSALSLADSGAGRPAMLPERLARAARIPAAVAGAGLCTYTAGLLAATSTPYWAAMPDLLGPRFACAAVAGAAATLSLLDRRAGGSAGDRLDRLTAVAAAGDLATGLLMARRCRATGVTPALAAGGKPAVLEAAALALAAVPVACALVALVRGRRGGSALGALAALAGGLVMRHAVLEAGNVSAGRPADTFRLARPGGAAAARRS